MVKANWWRPIPALALLLMATVLSASAGTPAELPGIALGWPLLLHLERGLALMGGLALVVLVGVRATMGHFPFRVGQVEYAMECMTKNFNETATLHREQLDVLKTSAKSPSTDETRG